MICPKCNSDNVVKTDESNVEECEPEWMGWYCYGCGNWWSI